MSEDGSDSQQSRPLVSPGRSLGRSASPAKRTADDMEAASEQHKEQRVPGSFDGMDERSDGDTVHDQLMSGMTPQPGDSQETVTDSNATSTTALTSATTSATSLQSDVPPSYSQDATESSAAQKDSYTTDEVDRQVAHVAQLADKPLDEGQRGVIISQKWLRRVLSRSSKHLNDKEFPKDCREGDVGPLDNSDIVPADAWTEPFLADASGKSFIPLLPGLAMNEDYQIFPWEVYGYILGEYGHSLSQKPITRFVRDTAPPGASQTNFQYDVYPPIITVRKVPHANSQPHQAVKTTKSFEALPAKQDQASRGQPSADDAVKLVSSKQEKFQKFLVRAKEAAGIPRTTKVKIWRMKDPVDVALDRPDNKLSGVDTPPASRDASPEKRACLKLVVDQDTFAKMDPNELEATDGKDESNNDKYNGSSTMDMLGFFLDSTMLLEEQMGGPAGGEFVSDTKKGFKLFAPKKPASTTPSGRTSPAPGVMTRGRTRKDGRTRGTVGLNNLGNTCYMNSALQCIRSVEELAVYFLSQKYKQEINSDNPLGYHGAIATAYNSVLRGIYEAQSSGSFAPNAFKGALGKAQPMFSGYGQQDSQEFLSFLVDALHEDLNRIHKKPYIENPDSEDSKISDPQYIIDLGNTYRTNHQKRNDSIAMDLFSGFYKNTMECPNCEKVSVTFDPFSLVTVQLPMEITFQHTITYIPRLGKPILHHLDIDKNASIKALKEVIAKKHPGTDPNCLWMAEVYSHKIYRVFDDTCTVAESSIGSSDYVFIWELDQAVKNLAKKSYVYGKNDPVPPDGMASPKADSFAVPIFQRTKNTLGNSWGLAVHPLYISLTREEAKDYEVILKKTLVAVASTTSRPILKEFEEDSNTSSRMEEIEGEKDQIVSEDAAGISDHSAQSEDGYVNVSVGKELQDVEMTNGVNTTRTNETYVPANFMDPHYFISPALRHQLFSLKYVESSEANMHCASMSSINERTATPMFDRVKKPSRRSSIQSSSSGDSSTTSGSADQANGEDDESDVDGGIDDRPDIVIGEQALANPDDSDEDELAGNTTIMEPSQIESKSRGGRQKRGKNRRGKNGKGRKKGVITYSKLDKARNNQNRGFGVSLPSRQTDPDSSYFIELGEGIIVDWHPEGWDSLFGGDRKSDDDMRGHGYISDNGRSGPIYSDPEQDARAQKREQRRKHGVNLEDCFEATRKKEILSEDNAWYCSRCKELRQAAKTLEIWTLPDILVVHLKRFGGNRSFRDKLDLKIDYPIMGLNMSDKVGLKEDGKEYIYDLFAVDNHYGGLGGGHYTAMAKSFYDQEWYDYNDSSVSKIGAIDRLQSAAAYLLFYRRRSHKPLGPQYLQDLVFEYRNPGSAAEEADDEESGEGRLGGPTLSSQHQHGSSSVLVGAGVGVMNRQQSHLSGNGSVGVSSHLTTKGMTNDDCDEDNGNRGVAGLLTQGPAWNFDGIQDQSHDDSEPMLGNFNRTGADDYENSSNRAEPDGDNDSGFDSDWQDPGDSGAMNSPVEHLEHADQDHEMFLDDYSGEQATATDLQKAGDRDLYDDDEEPATAEIHLDDSLKMD